ncbi:Intracellular distribution of mitochondria [Kluyveromyces marxianus]|nr:Intracellular distribution of mitochondria [Kluyveromyces marxianus]KAG0683637.1 Intracellular distribution of mitochondria [Kluyveromyces marxianus]
MSTDTIEVTVKGIPGQSKNKNSDLQYQLGKQSNVSHLKTYLSFEDATKFYTSYDLIENQTVVQDDDILEDLAGKNSSLTFHFKPKAYNVASAVQHILSLRETLGFSSELEDSISDFAISSGSQFKDMNLEPKSENAKEDPEEKAKFLQVCSEILDSSDVDFNISSLKTGNLLVSPVLRSLHFSAYNPVPAFYKTKGHLLYLQVVTLENETFHITSSISGFYVNKSSSIKFDPSPKAEFESKFNLVDLLIQVSKKFLQHVTQLRNKLSSTDTAQYAKPTSCFLSKPWLVSQVPTNNGDFMRTQLKNFTFDDERNFCDEFQAIKDLEINTPYDRVKNEKITASSIHEFNTEAVKGAMAVFNNELTPIDPRTTGENAVYFYKSLVFSYVFDVSGLYADIGGDEAAFAAANQDLQVINQLNRLGLKNIRHCLTAVIDYAGRRLLVQSPVPGLLTPVGTNITVDENNNEIAEPMETSISVNYGYDELTATLKFDEKLHTKLDEFSKNFYLKQHKVEEFDFKLSSKSKGIFGVDQRAYILDLANINPLDVEFAKKHYDSVKEDRYPHRQTLIRRELVEKWRSEKITASGKSLEDASEDVKFSYNPDAYVVDGVEDENVLEMSKFLNEEVLPLFLEDILKGNTNLPYDGQHLTNLFHTNGINMRYLGRAIEIINGKYSELKEERAKYLAKIEQENAEYKEWQAGYLKKVEQLIKERQDKINEYVQQQKPIPEELKKQIQLDKSDLKEPVKNEGFTIETDQYEGLIAVCELEIIARSLKHVFREHSKKLSSPILVQHLVAFFLNLLFGHSYNSNAFVEDLDPLFDIKDLEFAKITREQLLEEVRSQAKRRFRHELPENWLEIQEERFSKFAIIRAAAQKFGIQLINKEYFFTQEEYQTWKQAQDKKLRSRLVDPQQTFSINDFSLRPIVKGSEFQSLISEELWIQGASLVNAVHAEEEEAERKKKEESEQKKNEESKQKDEETNKETEEVDPEEVKQKEEREQKMNEALNLLGQSMVFREDVIGLVHPSLVSSYLLLSNMYSRLGRVQQAVEFGNKAVLLSERCFGVDSFETVRILSNLAYLQYAQGSIYNAALVLKKVHDLLKLLTPNVHAGRVNVFNLLFQIAANVKDSKIEVKILNKLSELLLKITDNEETLPFGQNESRIANLYTSIDDMKNALAHISKARTVFIKELGLNDQTTLTSTQWKETIESIITKQQQQKKLAATQQQVKPAEVTQKKGKKASSQNPELANKSVDELLKFIEGDSANSSKSSSKKSKKKSKNGKK